MKRLTSGKENPHSGSKRRIGKAPVLEPVRGAGTGRRGGSYSWTPEKVMLVENLVANRFTPREIAKRLNEEFPEEVQADGCIVYRKLRNDVYKRRPGLNRSKRWTPEKVEVLEKLVAKGLTSSEIAHRLNKWFPGGIITYAIDVDSKLNSDVYRRRPELKRRVKSEPYAWSPEKVERLEGLVAEGLTYREIVDRLNEEFPEGVRASENVIAYRLSYDVYKRRPELKRVEW